MSTMTIAVELVASSVGASNVSSMVSKINRLGILAKGLGANMSSSTQALIGFGIAAAGMDATFGLLLNTVETGIQDAGDLEMAITRLQLASGLTGDAFDNLKLSVVDMATHSLYSATDASGAFEKLTEMGFSAAQVMYGMGAAEDAVTTKSYDSTAALQGVGRQAMAVGEAMKTDATTGATLLGSALHTFNHDSLTAADAANLLVGAFYSGVPSAEALQQAINNAGAMADSAGISLQDFVTTLGLLAQAGLPADQAGTALRYMIQALIAPTNKQADALAYLGIRVTNLTPQLKGLLGELEKQGGAAAKAAKGYDGSVASLQKVFSAAQQARLVPLDETFNQWAEGIGALNSSLFDSKGNFKGMENAVSVLDKAMADKHLSMQQKMDMIATLFNVRSGRAAQILTNLDDFDKAYKKEWDKIGKTDALSNAMKILETFQGSIGELKTSIQSGLAEAFMPLLKAITPLVQGINNLIGAFLSLPPNVQGAVGIGLALLTVLTGLSGIVLTVVTGIMALAAIGVSLGSVFAVAAPIIVGIIVVFGELGGIIALVVTHAQQIGQFLSSFSGVATFFQNIGTALAGTIGPTIRDFLNSIPAGLSSFDDLKQRLGELGSTLAQLKPVLIVIAVVIGAVLAVAIGLLAGIVTGLIEGFIGLMTGLAQIFSGLVQIITGVVKLLQGIFGTIFAVIGDIIHGDWDKIQTDLITGIQNTVSGIGTILHGLWDVIAGIFNGILATIWGIVHGLVEGVVNFFNGLFDTLVGHSIIPDMVKAILQWINHLVNTFLNFVGNLVNRVLGFFLTLGLTALAHIASFVALALALANHFVNSFLGFFASLPDRVAATILTMINRTRSLLGELKDIGLDAGKGLIDNLVNAIQNGIGKVKDVVNSVGNAIGSVLHHSTPDEGPLKDDDQWGAHLVDNLITGMSNRLPNLARATFQVASTIRGPITTPALAASGPVSSSGSGQVIIPISLDGKQVAEYVVDLGTKRVKQSGSSRYAR